MDGAALNSVHADLHYKSTFPKIICNRKLLLNASVDKQSLGTHVLICIKAQLVSPHHFVLLHIRWLQLFSFLL